MCIDAGRAPEAVAGELAQQRLRLPRDPGVTLARERWVDQSTVARPDA